MQWFELYKIFSKSLNLFYQKYGKDSGRVLYLNYYEYINNADDSIKLDWLDKFNSFNVNSIDPMHIFASFNYWDISLTKRKERIKLFIDLIKFSGISIDNLYFDLENTNMDVFEYFPHINITHSVSARESDIQEEIWEFFDLIYRYDFLSDNEQTKFEKIYNNIETADKNRWYGIRYPSATIFMFWINSDCFIPLDKNTLALLERNNKVSKFPNTFVEYKQIISYQNKNLFRNLTRIAIDQKFESKLNYEEQEDIKKYFNKSIDVLQDNRKVKLNINHIDNYDFDLYFMTNYKVYKVVYRNNGIKSLDILNSNDINNVAYRDLSGFQIIALKCYSKELSKVLETEKLYYFNQNFIISENSIKIHENAVSLYKLSSIKNVNISAIVGKNGVGKSTIIELLIMAINNITYTIQNSSKNYDLKLEHFFYTIYTNYSIHSLNEKNYEGEWLQKLFHKNDAYQTPIVIEPYREYGVIDVNKLESFTIQRLISSILDPINYSEEKKYAELIQNIYATQLKISLKSEKLNKIIDNFSSTDIQSILNREEHRRILNFFDIENTSNHYDDLVKIYICDKVKSIAKTYTRYKDYINDYSNINYLEQLHGDKSHVTFKLFQAINFLKYDVKYTYNDDLNNVRDLSSNISFLISKYSNLSTIDLIPPSIFEVEIILNEDKNNTFQKLSSGQKQKIFTLSAIIYHLQNIDSRHRSNDSLLKYQNVNLILDEIELYFHPDMQRTFINDLLETIKNNGYLENILSLNIILVTHSPFILSDIPKTNIMYLHENKEFDEESEIGQTFGANIHTLLDNSFFMENGLMGEFAKKSIQKLIESISNGKENEKEEILREINIIGEPILKNKLLEMYYEAFPNRLEQLLREQERISEEINQLRKSIIND